MVDTRAWALAGWVCLLAGLPAVSASTGRGGETVATIGLPDGATKPERTVRAEGRGGPWVNVLDGRELAVVYRADAGGFEQRLRAERLTPLGLTSADLDGDGLADLIAAYADSDGAWVTLHRANLDARDPGGPRARRHRAEGTFREAPFLADARVVPLPVRPRRLVAGDFDGDGHADLAVADGETPGLWWLSGTGSGDLVMPRFVPLRGAVTALCTGDLDRRDGRAEVVAGISSGEGGEVVVLRYRDGALRRESTVLTLGARISAVAAGRLGGDKSLDLAVGAGDELTLLAGGEPGPGRKISWRASLPAAIRGLTFGVFAEAGDRGRGLALLLEDGTILVLRRETGTARAFRLTSLEDAASPAREAVSLVALNLSNRPGQDLMLRDRPGLRISVRIGGLSRGAWTTFETAAPAAAVIPMHLNGDIFSDLVVQLEGSAAPTVLMTSPRSIHTVDSTADDPDADVADGVCSTAGGMCTLRAALEQANAAAGTDAIGFAIPGTGPHTIQPLSPLPAITDSLVLDATTEPDYAGTPVVELDGSLAGDTSGLVIFAGSTTIAGLAVNRFESNGLFLDGPDATEDRIQANFIGTDVSGTTAAGNLGDGVFVFNGAHGNVIGTDGDGVADDREGNLVSGNGIDGILLVDEGTDDNVIAGNLVGTDVEGTTAIGNGGSGVAIVNYAASNRVGTDGDGISDVEERNVASGNSVRGVLVAGEAEGNVVAGNYIGTSAGGNQAVPNAGGGVEISNGARLNRIGTDADGQYDDLERNLISGNNSHGITLFGSPSTDDNVIAGNFIGTQADGTSPLGNQMHGIVINTTASYNRIGGLSTTLRSCDGPCNVIAFNGIGASLDGVHISDGIANAVVGNVIHSNEGGSGIDIGTAAASGNDPGDADGGANNGQNFPILTEATSSGGTTTVQGGLDSLPNTEFRVELYANSTCDSSGYGEGETLVAVHTLTTDATGQAAFSVPVTPEIPAGQWISATATRMEPGDVPTDTSEFSPCVGVGAVTSAATVPDGGGVPGTPLTVARGAVDAEVVLAWGPSCAAADTDYAVYIGTLGDFTSHFGRRCSTEGRTTATLRSSTPSLYFLIVPLSINREGSYGTDGAGAERPVGVSVCHPQLIGACD